MTRVWVNALAPMLPLGSALWLQLHWNELPSRFPLHWGFGGMPDRWGEKTASAVHMPPLLGVVIAAGLIALALTRETEWHSPRHERFWLLAFAWQSGILFAILALMPLYAAERGWPWAVPLVLGTTVLMALGAVVTTRRKPE